MNHNLHSRISALHTFNSWPQSLDKVVCCIRTNPFVEFHFTGNTLQEEEKHQ
jgi:hypothetical protein